MPGRLTLDAAPDGGSDSEDAHGCDTGNGNEAIKGRRRRWRETETRTEPDPSNSSFLNKISSLWRRFLQAERETRLCCQS